MTKLVKIKDCFMDSPEDRWLELSIFVTAYSEKEKPNRMGSQNHMGLIMFVDGQYFQSFIMNEHEVNAIKNNTNLKSWCIDDLSYRVIFGEYKLDFTRRYSSYTLSSSYVTDMQKMFPGIDYVSIFEEVVIFADPCMFIDVIRDCINNPLVSDSISHHYLPKEEDVEVIERVCKFKFKEER